MPKYFQIAAIVILAFVPFVVTFTVKGPPTTSAEWLRTVSFSITSVSVGFLAFHLFLWRILPDFLAPRPFIGGTWKVEAKTATGKPFSGFMFVRQQYWLLSMRLETEVACSELVAEQITCTKGGAYELWAVYRCEPHPHVDPSEVRPHYGALWLQVVKRSIPDRKKNRFQRTHSWFGTDAGGTYELKGRYWIDGDLVNKAGEKIEDGKLILQR